MTNLWLIYTYDCRSRSCVMTMEDLANETSKKWKKVFWYLIYNIFWSSFLLKNAPRNAPRECFRKIANILCCICTSVSPLCHLSACWMHATLADKVEVSVLAVLLPNPWFWCIFQHKTVSFLFLTVSLFLVHKIELFLAVIFIIASVKL